MRRVNSAMAAVLLLAALILPGLNGQQPAEPEAAKKEEKEMPPLKVQCQAVGREFVKGQNVELRCVFLFKTDVNINFDDLKKISDKNFTLVGFSTTPPTPVPSQKDYSYSILTKVLRPDPELGYGKYPTRLSLGYQYHEVAWKEQDGKKVLQTKVMAKVENLPPIVFEKVSLFARVDGGEGFQDVVNIGEHILYTLHIFYEKNAVIVLNNMSLVELDKKYGVRDATQLDNPDLKPFVVINKDDLGKKRQIDRGYHAELVYEYRIALYEVSLVKMFEVPSINLYYAVRGVNKAIALSTPVTKIRTNSVLNQDSDFRPLKGILKSDPEKSRKLGFWPLRTAYALAALAGLITLIGFLLFLARYLKKIYRTGLRGSLAEVRKSFAIRFGGLRLVARLHTLRVLTMLEEEPNQENLKKFIKALRLYMAVLVRIDVKLALSLTVQEFGLRVDAEVLENAEYLLDEDITHDDVAILRSRFKELVSVKKAKKFRRR